MICRMKFPYILVGISTLIWCTIPFRQFSKKYFYFFYFYGIAEPLTAYLRIIFHSPSNIFYLVFHYLMLISIFPPKFVRKYKIPLSVLFIAITVIYILSGLYTYLLIIGILDFLILYQFFIDIFNSAFKQRLINLFLFVLILNFILEIFQYLGIYFGYLNGYFYFYTVLTFEMFIGVFLLIFREDNPKLLIKI